MEIAARKKAGIESEISGSESEGEGGVDEVEIVEKGKGESDFLHTARCVIC